jgi:hypothetical protein
MSLLEMLMVRGLRPIPSISTLSLRDERDGEHNDCRQHNKQEERGVRGHRTEEMWLEFIDSACFSPT